jgi:hypothetical protein
MHPTGGLRPPLLCCSAHACRRKAIFATHIRTFTRAAGVSRQPAVAVGNTFAQIQARLFAEPPTVYVRVAVAFAVIVTTGGLRPPLLCCSANVCRRKNDFCDAHTHIRSGAAGVSPPWVSKLRMQLQCDEFRISRSHRMHPTGGLRPPLLFRGAHVCRRKSDFCDAHTHIRSGAAGVSPPWLVIPTLHCKNRASFRDRRTHVYKSGGREPAVAVGNTLAQIQARLFAEPPTVYVRVAVAFAVIVTTGGLRPPLLCCGAHACRRKAIFAMHIRTSDKERRASARRGLVNRVCNCNATNSVFRVRIECTPTGGLRPPLLLQRECLPAKKRFLRCTYARSQERRASARRGLVNCVCNCNATNSVFRVRIECTPTGGLRPPLLCCGAHACRRKAIFAMHIRTSDQERRSSARRGSGMAPARAMQRMFAAWRCVQTLSTLNELLVVIATDGMFAARRCVQTLSTLNELLVVIATDGMFSARRCVQMLSRGACGSDRVCSE